MKRSKLLVLLITSIFLLSSSPSSAQVFCQRCNAKYEHLNDYLEAKERIRDTLFVDLSAQHYLTYHFGDDLSGFSPDEVLQQFRQENDFRIRFALNLFPTIFLHCKEKRMGVLKTLERFVNNPKSPYYLISIEVFFLTPEIPSSILQEFPNDDFDVFFKRVIIAKEKKSIASIRHHREFFVKFESEILDDSWKIEFGDDCLKEILEVNSLGRIGKILFSHKYFSFSKTIFERLFSNPNGLQHGRVDEGRYDYMKFKEKKSFRVMDQMFKRLK